MPVLTTYCDYFVFSPDYFIEYIQGELAKRDIPGLSNGKIDAVKVSGDHPLVTLLASTMQSGTPRFEGLLPAISVVGSDEPEEGTTVGQGLRPYTVMTQAKLDLLNTVPIATRYKNGLITDGQIATIQTAITEATSHQLRLGVDEFYQAEKIFVSLWTQTLQEVTILGKILSSILYTMRKDMIANRLINIKQRTDIGLRNTNFGRILYGQETAIDYRNTVRNFTVYDDEPRNADADVKPVNIYRAEGTNDEIQQYPEEES